MARKGFESISLPAARIAPAIETLPLSDAVTITRRIAPSRNTSEARHDDAIVSEGHLRGRGTAILSGAPRSAPSSICHRSAAYRLPPSLSDRLSTTRLSPAALLAMRMASRRSHSLLTNPCSTTAPFSTDTVTCSS